MIVLIVDDHPLVRKGLTTILSLENSIEKISEASNIEQAMSLLEKEKADIAIIDLRLGKECGLDIVDRAKKNLYSTKFVILTSSMRKEDFQRAQDAGVEGYILKDAFTDDITYALRVVSRGKKYIDPEILSYLQNQLDSTNPEHLTNREKEILVVLGEGLSNQQIADKLVLSENTVKKHISSVLSKLGLQHRTQAAIYANSINNFNI